MIAKRVMLSVKLALDVVVSGEATPQLGGHTRGMKKEVGQFAPNRDDSPIKIVHPRDLHSLSKYHTYIRTFENL